MNDLKPLVRMVIAGWIIMIIIGLWLHWNIDMNAQSASVAILSVLYWWTKILTYLASGVLVFATLV